MPAQACLSGRQGWPASGREAAVFFHTAFGQWIDAIMVRIVPRKLEEHPFDYTLHFLISFLGCLATWEVLSFLFPKIPVRLRKGAVIVFWAGVGAGKELIDFRFGWDDIASDALGIAAAMYVIRRKQWQKRTES